MAKRNHFRNAQKKLYRSQKFRNPYFQVKELNYRQIAMLSIAGLVVLTILTTRFLFNDHFTIRNVDVQGTKYFSTKVFEDVLRRYFDKPFLLVFDHRNRFVYQEQDLQKQLRSTFAFESLTLRLEDQTLHIGVVEKDSIVIWQTATKQYVVDLEGTIVRDVATEDMLDLPIFVDRNNTPVSIGARVMTKQEVENILLFHEQLTKQQIAIQNTQIDRVAGKWMGVETQQGYEILFDATGDIVAQAERLQIILRDKVPDVARLNYIDLRFGDHVYFQ